MANDEVQKEQEKNEAANAEDDMDSLMDELEGQQAKTENIEGSEDLNSLITQFEEKGLNADMLKEVWLYNEEIRSVIDWPVT